MIDVATLPSMPLTNHKRIPPISAIYFCLDENRQILYIGQTENLRKRWQAHHRYTQLKQLGNISLAWVPCKTEELEATEKHLIEVFQPSLNYSKVSVPSLAELLKKAKDMKRLTYFYCTKTREELLNLSNEERVEAQQLIKKYIS